MTLISKLAISLFISVTSIFVLAKPPTPTAQETQPAPITVWQGLEQSAPLPTTTLATTPITQPDACETVYNMARHVGWPEAELTKVVAVAYRESRCLPDAFNGADTVGQSYGAMQVNDFWCLPSKYYPNGYMQAYGLLTVCDDLFDLETNLRAALNIWRYSNGWRAWSL
jgi:hypothetical protein